MRPVKWTCALAFLALSLRAEASNVEGVTVAHFEPLERFQLFEVGEASTARTNDGTRAARATFDALGRTFDLQLEPNTALLASATRRGLGDDVGVYRGRIADNERSWVRLVIVDGMPRGLIWDGTELLAVESPDDSMLNTTEPAIFRMSDVTIAPGVMSCGVAGPPANGSLMYRALAAELSVAAARAPGAVEEILVGAVGDFEFTDAMGANAQAAITTRLNNVDGIFSDQLAIQISIDVIETFTDSNDPFTDTTDAETLLDEVADYRQMTPAQNQTGITHLYTARDLDGTTAGIAYVGAICSTNFGAGLSEGVRGAMLDSLISAHEIGHNFNADHDGDADGSCPAEAQIYLMAPSVSLANNSFGPCSIGVMQTRAAAASCVTPLPVVDMTVGTSGQPASILLGSTEVVTFDVTNNGAQGATGVTANISLPNNVSLVSSSSSQGSCTDGAGTVSCSFGNVGGNTGGTMSVTVTADAVGPASFTATVTADSDENANNNQVVLQSSVDPAVDLVVGSPSSPSIALNQSGTLSSVLSNVSSLAASSVTVNVTLPTGLRADGASLAGGACTVTAQDVDCTLGTLAAQATANLTVDVTGTQAGSLSYTVAINAQEADAVPANNSSGGTVTVTTNSGGSSGGGGGNDDGGSGSTGLLFSVLLAAACWRRRSAISGLRPLPS